MVVLAFWAVSLPIRDWRQFLSASVAQTFFPVQLGGPPQVAAPPAQLAAGLVLSPDCRPIPAKISLWPVRGDAGFSDGQCQVG